MHDSGFLRSGVVLLWSDYTHVSTQYGVKVQLPLVCVVRIFVGRGIDLCPTLETRRNEYSMAKTDREICRGLQ